MAEEENEPPEAQPKRSGVSVQKLIAAMERTSDVVTSITNSPAYRAANDFHNQMRDLKAEQQAMMDGIREPMRQAQEALSRRLNERVEMQAAIEAIREPWQQTVRDIAAMQNSAAARYMQEAAAAYRQNVSPLADTYNALRLTSPMAQALADIRALHTDWIRTVDVAAPALESFRAAIAQAALSPSYREYFEGSVAHELLERLEEAETAPSPEEKAQQVSNLLLWLEQTIRESPANRLIYVALIYIVFQLAVPLAFDKYIDAPAEQRQAEEMERRFDQLGKEITAYKAAVEALPEQHTMYGVTKRVIVHEEPSSGSKRVAVLLPGATFEEVEREGRWLYIEYFNHVDWELHRGWVYKRNLVVIEPWEEAAQK